MESSRVFVTVSTGLLGNNLVRQLLDRGFAVRALARSRTKAERRFADVPRGAVHTSSIAVLDGPASSLVGARDVVGAMIAVAAHGRRGERYLAAGRHMTMDDLLPALATATGVPAQPRRIPLALLFVIARVSEVAALFTRRPVLLSLATVRILSPENDRSRFDHAKSQRELAIKFRAVSETLRDTADWFRTQGMIAARPSRADHTLPILELS